MCIKRNKNISFFLFIKEYFVNLFELISFYTCTCICIMFLNITILSFKIHIYILQLYILQKVGQLIINILIWFLPEVYKKKLV